MTEVELDEAYIGQPAGVIVAEQLGCLQGRKLPQAARRGGHDIGRDQVARLMKIAGISGDLAESTARSPPVATTQRAAASRADQAWLGLDRHRSAVGRDFSYVWTLAGFRLVAFVVDVFAPGLGPAGHHQAHRHGHRPLRPALQVRRCGEGDWVPLV